MSGLSDHAVSESVYLSDPDGLGIEVYADRPRGRWRTLPDGQLYMTTQPLNVDGLVAFGGDAAWDQAPSGTVMGHVHLHVGDLGHAEAFYHRAVGFDKIVWSYPGALFFSAGGYHHHVGTNTWSSGVKAPDDQARLLSWDLETVEPDAVAASITVSGYPAVPDGTAWRVEDPWGTIVEIHQWRI